VLGFVGLCSCWCGCCILSSIFI